MPQLLGENMKHDWQPNTELNAKVAKALGWTQHDSYKHLWYGKGDQAHAQPLSDFSGDMTAAWIVVEILKTKTIEGAGFFKIVCEDTGYLCGWEAKDGWIISEYETSAPLAICLAFLKSVGNE